MKLDIGGSQVGDNTVGIALLGEIKVSKNKAPHVVELRNQKSVQCVTFDRALVKTLESATTALFEVQIEHGVYNDADQFTLRKAVPYLGNSYVEADFVPSTNIVNTWNEFTNLLKSNLSENYYEVAKIILSDERIRSKVSVWFAGKSMHDALRGGLINHKRKIIKIALTLVENDPRLSVYVNEILLSIALHDVGKVFELTEFGQYHAGSVLGHRIPMAGIMYQKQSEIEELIGEEGFMYLISVIIGHHGNYEDKPTTVVADIVHLIDLLESRTTGYLDDMSNGKVDTINGRFAVYSREYDRYLFY